MCLFIVPSSMYEYVPIQQEKGQQQDWWRVEGGEEPGWLEQLTHWEERALRLNHVADRAAILEEIKWLR
jgi:hypothetical protein